MSIADLFHDLHGALDKSKLISLNTLIGKKGGRSKVELLPTKKEFNKVVKYLEIDPNKIFYDPLSYVNRIIYLSKYIYFAFPTFSLDFLTQMGLKEKLKDMQEKFGQCEKEKDYISIFSFMDKKLLIPTYKEIFDEIPDDQKYEIFADLYVRSEYGFEIFDDEFLKRVFSYQKFSTEYPKRLEKLKQKIGNKEKFIIYHGHNQDHDPKDEYSWTLEKSVAKFFANRFDNKNGVISQKTISLNDVIDFYDHRGEEEIILLTDNLK